jgi:hypothetical protein
MIAWKVNSIYQTGRFAIFNTAYGDGEYEDQNGHKYCVDAGSIGCVMLRDVSSERYENLSELGRIVDFETKFGVSKNNDTIAFGHIRIPTSDTWNDDREEDYDEEVFDDWENDK